MISKNNIKFDELKPKSIVGTSSLRREYQLKRKRNDLIFKLIRGNVDTRIKKLKEGTYDAIILSKAGIDCLKLNDQISEEFLNNDIIPSAGQGIIAIQCRQEDSEMIDLLKKQKQLIYSCSCQSLRSKYRKKIVTIKALHKWTKTQQLKHTNNNTEKHKTKQHQQITQTRQTHIHKSTQNNHRNIREKIWRQL